MPTPTTNYNLLKPSVGESYNVQLFDDNYDKIDAGMHGIASVPGLIPYAWAQKTATFGTPWDGINDSTLRAPDMGSKTFTNRIGLTDNDIVMDDQDGSNHNNTYRLKKPGLWFCGFRLMGGTQANAQRVTLGVSPLTITPPTGVVNDNWGSESGAQSAQFYDDGTGSVSLWVSYGHFLWKTTVGDTIYRPGMFAKRSGTTPIGNFAGTMGFTYLGAFPS